ncbi:hypothetical protein EV2_029779 [Malus domestica]
MGWGVKGVAVAEQVVRRRRWWLARGKGWGVEGIDVAEQVVRRRRRWLAISVQLAVVVAKEELRMLI